jgi:hypothetical protein
MPWSQTMPMDQRVQSIFDYLRDSLALGLLSQRQPRCAVVGCI